MLDLKMEDLKIFLGFCQNVFKHGLACKMEVVLASLSVILTKELFCDFLICIYLLICEET